MIQKPKFMVLAVSSFMDMDEIQYSTSRPPAELLNPTIRLTLMQCTHTVSSVHCQLSEFGVKIVCGTDGSPSMSTGQDNCYQDVTLWIWNQHYYVLDLE